MADPTRPSGEPPRPIWEEPAPVLNYARVPKREIYLSRGTQILAGIVSYVLYVVGVWFGAMIGWEIAASNAAWTGALVMVAVGLAAVIVVRVKTGWQAYLPAFFLSFGLSILLPLCGLSIICGGIR